MPRKKPSEKLNEHIKRLESLELKEKNPKEKKMLKNQIKAAKKLEKKQKDLEAGKLPNHARGQLHPNDRYKRN